MTCDLKPMYKRSYEITYIYILLYIIYLDIFFVSQKDVIFIYSKIQTVSLVVCVCTYITSTIIACFETRYET